MKKIEIIIRPARLEDVKEALVAININGISVSQVMGCGRQMGWTEVYRGTKYELNFLPKIQMELVVKDADLEKVLATVTEAARTGDIGDGKIFIYDVADVLRIRTGERGEDAI
jgi:nitrogen regulatory protein P-II 1